MSRRMIAVTVGILFFVQMATAIVGTMLIQVHSYCSTSSHQVEAEKRCGATMLPPDRNGVIVEITCPLMW